MESHERYLQSVCHDEILSKLKLGRTSLHLLFMFVHYSCLTIQWLFHSECVCYLFQILMWFAMIHEATFAMYYCKVHTHPWPTIKLIYSLIFSYAHVCSFYISILLNKQSLIYTLDTQICLRIFPWSYAGGFKNVTQTIYIPALIHSAM